jgi:nucleoside-diphosphate-sugar epimerase
MRFDLVINIFSLYSSLHNEIRVFGAGDQYRPFLHVSDCARAFLHLCEQPALNSLRYNVASENLRVNDVAAIFQCINPRMQVVHVPTEDIDRRDYRVNTKRMEETGFRPLVAIRSGIEEMMEAIVSGVIADPESLYYRNAKWLKELMDIGSRDHRSVIDLMESFPRAWRAYAGH